jgi:hypothetical protein
MVLVSHLKVHKGHGWSVLHLEGAERRRGGHPRHRSVTVLQLYVSINTSN